MYTEKKKMNVNVELTIQKIIEMAVLKTSFRIPEVNLGFVTSARGAGHLTPKKSLGRGAFDQRKGPHGREFDQKKNVKCPGVSRGGAWAPLELTRTLIRYVRRLNGWYRFLGFR